MLLSMEDIIIANKFYISAPWFRQGNNSSTVDFLGACISLSFEVRPLLLPWFKCDLSYIRVGTRLYHYNTKVVYNMANTAPEILKNNLERKLVIPCSYNRKISKNESRSFCIVLKQADGLYYKVLV